LVVGDDDGYIYGLDADTGSEVWSAEAESGVLADLLLAEEIVYVSTKDGDVLALDPSDGGIYKKVASP
jgi:outer membrane protein assembly factor BamB